MKALIISPQPFFSPRGTPLSVYYRTLITAELGVEVDLLTYGQGEDVDLPGVRIIRIPAFRFLGAVKVGPSLLKLFLDIFIFLKLIRLLSFNRYDFVHAHEEAGFMCYFLKPLFRFKLIYDMHSSLPQQLTNFKFTRSTLLIKLFEKLENATLRAADAVITICEDLFRYADPLLYNGTPHLLIENSLFDPVRTVASPEKSYRDYLSGNGSLNGLANKKWIVYTGTLEPYQGMELVLQGFQTVAAQDPGTLLIIAGGNPEQVSAYRRLAEKLDIAPHCIFTGMVPKNVANQLNERAQVLLSPRISGNNTPLKIYEQLASGKPLVATRIRSHTQVLSEEVAFLADPEPSALAESMLAALHDAPAIATKTARAQALYREKYAREIYRQKLQSLLEALR